MLKCRICLSTKRNLLSIYETSNGNSFAFMMTSLANNIKIDSFKGITEEICKICSQKLLEAYNFKGQIESSDEILWNAVGVRKIYFANLKEKMEVKIGSSDEITQQCKNEIINCFKKGETAVDYNNTTIQKLEGDSSLKKENEPWLVMDFLKAFKSEPESDFHNISHSDDDYIPQSDINDEEDPDFTEPLSKRKRKVCKRKIKKKNRSTDKVNKQTKEDSKRTFIKPVILSDIQVLPTKCSKESSQVKKNYRNDKMDMCNYCGKMTRTIKSHLLVHTGDRSYKCDICSKAFLTVKCLNRHKTYHNKEKAFKCDQCVATFNNARSLKSHYIKHSDEKKFVCDFCSKAFKRRNALWRHKLMHNMANKCIKCDLCNMSFFTKYGMRHHLRVHTGERPYNCEICSQPYSYKHDFNRHCLKKHGIFLKRRSVYVMNEEVMKRERAFMRDLMLKIQGIGKEGELLNPFEGPQGALAFEQAVRALEEKNIPIDLN